jgi:hypothetical protein
MTLIVYQPPKVAKIDPYSLAAYPLELLANKNVIGHGSGFLWRHRSELFLVTNWHVLSAITPETGVPLEGT